MKDAGFVLITRRQNHAGPEPCWTGFAILSGMVGYTQMIKMILNDLENRSTPIILCKKYAKQYDFDKKKYCFQT